MVDVVGRSVDTFTKLLYDHSLQVDYLVEKWENDELKCELHEVICVMCGCLKRRGKIIMVGCGKSSKVAKKTVAMLQSLGLPSLYLHPTEALHGDAGCIKNDDCLLLCSTSGETDEIITFMRFLQKMDTWSGESSGSRTKRIAICSTPNSSMSAMCDNIILIPQRFLDEEIQDGLRAPTISTSSMLIILDCLSLALSNAYYDGDLCRRNELFNEMHPAGGIGKRFSSTGAGPKLGLRRPMAPASIAKIRPAMDELELLQMLVLHDWIIVDDIATLPSKIVQVHYKSWRSHRDSAPSNFCKYLCTKIARH